MSTSLPPPAASSVPLSLELALGALTAIAPLSIDMYIPAFVQIGASLSSTTAAVQLTLAAFFVGFASAQLGAGPIIDRFGRRTPLLAGLVVYVVGSLVCAAAPSVLVLTVGRVVQALGGAFAVVVPRAIVRDVASGAAAARLFSRLLLVMGTAPIVAPLLGGWLSTTWGWRSIFAVLALFGVALIATTLLFVPATTTTQRSARPWRAVFGDRQFLRFTLAGGCASAAMFAYIAGSPFVLIELHGVAADDYGFFFGANAAGLIGASQINRRLLQTRSPREVVSRSGVVFVVAASFVMVAFTLTTTWALWAIAGSLWCCIACLGLFTPNTSALAFEGQAAQAGLASAVLGAMQFAIAAAAAGAVSALHDGTAVPMATVMLVLAVVAFALQRGR
jgi:DHA1 family bicyclomycin/chloramphenicol resistance-like MFS transporter